MIVEHGMLNLPEGWCWTTLEMIANAIDPQPSHRTPPSVEGGIPYIGIGDITKDGKILLAQARKVSINVLEEHQARYQLKFGDFIFGKIGTIGKPVKLTEPFTYTLSANVVLIQPKLLRIVPDYLFRYMSSPFLEKILTEGSRATTQAAFGIQRVRLLPVPLPPFFEQQRIISVVEQQFTRLDAAVTALQHARTKLKRYRAAVLKAAVEGKLTEAWRAEHPATEPASALLERILVERRAKWEADLRAKGKDLVKGKYVEPVKPDVESLPELPEGWCWATLNELSWHVTSGSRGWAQYYASSGSLFVRVGNFNRLDTKIDLQNVVYVRAPNNLEADRCRLQVGDLLITITADVGMVGIVDEHVLQWGEAFINQHVGLVRFVYPELTVFVALALASEPLQAQIRNKQYGATKTGLNLEDLKSFVVPLPPVDEQQCIYAEVEHCLSQVQELEAVIDMNLKRAERLRQSILKEAFAGRLVPQDPNDEPVSMLLERIHKEHEEQKPGPIKKPRELKTISVPRMPDVEPVDIDASEMEQMDLWTSIGSRE